MAWFTGWQKALIGAAAVLALSACQPNSLSFQGTDVTGATLGQDLSLTDHNGQARHLEDFKGKVPVVFFGFAQCPDVCPTTLAELVQVKEALGERAKDLQVVFVTVDPERDTPAVLKQYVTQFDPSFLALTGSPEEVSRVAQSFRVFYAKVPNQDGSSYTMDHSAGLYIFDKTGNIRVFARHNAGAEALAHDIGQLL
ncbi:MAG: SCO family protein [Pigmentiphaga sp.]|nr:SCO family protein [Pigmentiphaga sp.]